MGRLMLNGISYTGSAGSVNYSETTLWNGSETTSTSGTQITLSDNISNYDEIIIALHANNSSDLGFTRYPVSELVLNNAYIQDIYGENNCGSYFVYDTDNKITIKSIAAVTPLIYTKVIGVKYGNGTETYHNYYTAEKIVGTWIDGSTIYEKTIQDTFANATSLTIDISTLTPKYILDIEGILLASDSPSVINIGNDDAGAVRFAGVVVSGSTAVITVAKNSAGAYGTTSQVYVTIRYTKTST